LASTSYRLTLRRRVLVIILLLDENAISKHSSKVEIKGKYLETGSADLRCSKCFPEVALRPHKL